ncbi:fucose-specific lectin [Glonium stellatum]|uniref:Fucose-specific lectin n=1 Tax=Glonium stellatum TaxID=574774 RepID=A0A8E2JL41_9PEZI|nr:fucose-specific lectin [Glonium stellatum]
MASRRSNEGLEVVPQDPPRYPAKNYYEGDQSPHVVYGYPSPPPFEAKQYEENYPIPTSTEAQTYTPKKSSKLRLWWIIFAIFLVIAVVVGGAIKGLLAISKNKKNQVNANAPTAVSTQGVTTTPATNTASLTSTVLSSPTSTGSVCRGTACQRVLSAISSEPNVGMVFALGTDKGLYYKNANGSTWDNQWSSLGGVFTFPPVAISWGAGRIDILGIGTDGAMYTQCFDNNQWSGNWTSLGGVFSTPPTVTSWGKQRLDVFALGTDNSMYHKAYGGGEGLQWDADWGTLQGTYSSPPAAVSWGANRIDIWSGWESLGGGPFETVLVAVLSDLNRLEVLALGSNDDAIWHRSLVASTWSGYTKLGGVFDSAPAAVSFQAKGLDAFGIGTNAAMYHHSWSGGQWSGSTELR